MDGSEDDSATRGSLLLSQLDRIFQSDPLIDELGFVHPSQLTSLHAADESTTNDLPFPNAETNNTRGSTISASTGAEEPHARADCSRKSEHGVDRLDTEGLSFQEEEGVDVLPYDPTAFWCGDHKLAVSMLALAPMYKCARAAFMSIRSDYKKLLQAEEGPWSAQQSETVGVIGTMPSLVEYKCYEKSNTAAEKLRLEDNLMSYSRALVLINCDYASAWSTRRRVILSRAVNHELLSEELRMAGVVLSCGPKSEETWAYRRWVINQMISGGISQPELDLLLEAESKLVEAVAERSLMNYRAWRHRCWLVSQMSFLQVGIELHRTKAWASSHVADNCCFHFRRTLLLKLVNSKVPERNQLSLRKMTVVEKEMDMKSLRVSLLDGPVTTVLWKEEMDWTKDLIQLYIGREALWIHLRFLLFSWVEQVGPMFICRISRTALANDEKVSGDMKETLCDIYIEQAFVDDCLCACSSVLTEAGDRQREFAATYRLWLRLVGQQQNKPSGRNGCQTTHQDDFDSLEQLLHDVAPYRKQLWAGLLPNLELARTDFS
ncbi:unnamed protein product [Calypogeia fissa]